MFEHLYALTEGWSGLQYIFAILIGAAVIYATDRLFAPWERPQEAKHHRGAIITGSEEAHASPRPGTTSQHKPRPANSPTSAFAIPPSTPVHSALPYPEPSQNPARKRTRKLRAQMANSMAAHASTPPTDNH
jgi:hypothetical protein